MVHTVTLQLLLTLAYLATAVVTSGYERRTMAMLHNRDGPVYWWLTGLLQPVTDGMKLIVKAITCVNMLVFVRLVVGCILLFVGGVVAVMTLLVCYCCYWSCQEYVLPLWFGVHAIQSIAELWLGSTQPSTYARMATTRIFNVLLVADIVAVCLLVSVAVPKAMTFVTAIAMQHTSGVLLALVWVIVLWVLSILLEGGVHPYDVMECEPELVSGYYVDLGSVVFVVCYLSEGLYLVLSLLLVIVCTYTSYCLSVSTMCLLTIAVIALVIVWRFVQSRYRVGDVMSCTTLLMTCTHGTCTATCFFFFF
uniref:NADH-ubiquinone oxidoreductase chain 1 n=1 Tax=Diplonema sp. ATCC 50224 TaxID=91375 RepID=A0A2D2AJT5_9EUGL|nr:NADH dehydrogenase subunit 1 [Diplonema sp. ATCC 50224]